MREGFIYVAGIFSLLTDRLTYMLGVLYCDGGGLRCLILQYLTLATS